jgi:hypothetical protein
MRPKPIEVFAACCLAAAVVAATVPSVQASVENTLHIGGAQPVVATASAADYTFAFPTRNAPARWDPCKPIHYVVSTHDLPADGVSVVQEELGKISGATGLRFVFDGTVADIPTTAWLKKAQRLGTGQHAPVLIGWARHGETDLFDHSQEEGTTSSQATVPTKWLLNAVVVIDAARASGALANSVTLHEFGHVAGLGHTNGYGEIMQPSPPAQDVLGPGDLAGLALLGVSKSDRCS